ncbi:hypothetical protein KsCSTR_34880 [Candidatus Kuenenia stuttgartiensis]|uniref:Uncharacterized protein n=1 Tax=Kuenenia stuttgartiensis TaxID=174633 RepID=Q1Q6X8_KUEST|nr:hypothetical protein KsCSTR_34880 [Candidatus Kuenenia stuttgartiensis]CAJ73324.1 unknown protein [Candidatus Kuenenia stuttgartiensis]
MNNISFYNLRCPSLCIMAVYQYDNLKQQPNNESQTTNSKLFHTRPLSSELFFLNHIFQISYVI